MYTREKTNVVTLFVHDYANVRNRRSDFINIKTYSCVVFGRALICDECVRACMFANVCACVRVCVFKCDCINLYIRAQKHSRIYIKGIVCSIPSQS